MALKKGMFENYVKERQAPVNVTTNKDKYSHNRVFDEPESLKKSIINQEVIAEPISKPLDVVELEPSISFHQTEHEQLTHTSDKHVIENEQLKPNTNLTQSEHKPDTKTQHKVNTNSTQSEHKIILNNINQTQSRHKVDTKLNTLKTQSRHKPDTNLTQKVHISTLVGVQRMILLFIFEECKKTLSPLTEPLSILHIASGLDIAPGSIKTSIARLCEKEFLKINSFKNGRGGWSIYEIPDNIYKELFQIETQHKLHTNYTQSRHKVDTKLNTQPNTNASSSSSKDLKTTTTELSPEWYFDISSYQPFGFTHTQLKQLASLNVISAGDVEQSLIEFSYDLNNNALPSIKTGKINFLMGLLRSGHAYVSEGFKNEQQKIILEMARRAEDKRKSLLEAKFEAWEANLNDEERSHIERQLPTHLIVLSRTYGISNTEVRNWLMDYYLKYNN